MNRTVVVRYKVHPSQAQANQSLIAAVFQQLSRERPAGLRYQVVRLEDGVSFMHMATVAEGQPHPLTSLAAFKAFTAEIAARCEEPPVTTRVELLGAYSSPET